MQNGRFYWLTALTVGNFVLFCKLYWCTEAAVHFGIFFFFFFFFSQALRLKMPAGCSKFSCHLNPSFGKQCSPSICTFMKGLPDHTVRLAWYSNTTCKMTVLLVLCYVNFLLASDFGFRKDRAWSEWSGGFSSECKSARLLLILCCFSSLFASDLGFCWERHKFKTDSVDQCSLFLLQNSSLAAL